MSTNMTFNEICGSKDPKIALYDLLSVLVIDIESEAILRAMVEGVQCVAMEDSALAIEMETGDNLYIYPSVSDKKFTAQPQRYQELAASFSGLSYPEASDWGLHFGDFEVDPVFTEIKHSFAPIQEHDNWYFYNSANELCFISHEGGSVEKAKYADTGVAFLYELAQMLYMDIDKIKGALPFESDIKLVISKEFCRFEEPFDTVTQLNISPDRSVLVMAGSDDSTLRLTNTQGETIKEFHTESCVFPTAFSSCGSYFAFGGRDRKITLVDMKTKEVQWLFFGEDSRIDADILADETTKLTVGESSGHNNWLKSLTFSADGTILFSGSNGVVAAHSCTTGTLLFSKVSAKREGSWITVLEVLNNNELLFSNKEIVSIDVATQEIVHTFPISGALSGTISENKEFVVLSKDSTSLFKSNGDLIRKLSDNRAFAVAISNDNRRVALLRDAPAVDILNIEGELLCRLPLDGEQNGTMSGYSIEFFNDKTLLVEYPQGILELSIEDVL